VLLATAPPPALAPQTGHCGHLLRFSACAEIVQSRVRAYPPNGGSKNGPRGMPWPRGLKASGFASHANTIGDGMGRALAMQLVCGFRNLAALIAGPLELVRRRQARAIAAGDRRGAVG